MQRHPILELMRHRLLIFDGATGSNLQQVPLGPDDFAGKEGCNEILVRTRPDVVRELHASFLQVGCQVVETNSFGSTSIVLAEYDLADEAYELNRQAATLARQVARDYQTAERPRFVAGSMGPTTKLPSLSHVTFDQLLTAYREQAAGLLAGGVDLLLVETCQDPLQVRAAVIAIRRELAQQRRLVPLMISLTVELSGTMLLGTELAAALTTIAPLQPDILGLNCATGPLEMKTHLQLLSGQSPFPLAALPNAGLPENIDGRTVYPLSPDAFASWHESFVREEGVQVVGGCCGTTPEHLAALVQRVDNLQPAPRVARLEPSVSSLYFAWPLAQEPRPFLVGERTNANGSKRFRELLLADRFDELVELARDQEQGGAHALDLCTAYVGRDELRDMSEAVSRFTRQVRLPLVIDSTQPEVMEAALKLHGGRCVLNSINLEDGEDKARAILALAAEHGAAVIALAIDEQGMARTVDTKLAICERLLRLATEEFCLAPGDLLFDMLTFTVGSGDPELRSAAAQTLEAIRQLKARCPGVHTVLGVSNISFGLKPRARHVLNSVFLQLAVEAGLDLAIIDAAKLRPLARIPAEARLLAENLLFDRRAGEADPLLTYIDYFEQHKEPTAAERTAADQRPLPERLRRKVVEGDRSQLELLLASALTRHTPLAIINEMLIPGMKEVGELFGAGQLQLPFVLQSAEVMKQAVTFLEPLMERSQEEHRGTLVLATVRGDVHDIGKNLVDILLSNNGYRVINLGIKVPIEEMIRVWQAEQADAIGMSGLLVKSTLVMKENLEELRRRGLNPHVLLGGAALTRRYVEQDLRALYGERVSYGKDAFEGLSLLQQLLQDGAVPAAGETAPANVEQLLRPAVAEAPAGSPEPLAPAELPRAPFFGSRLQDLALPEVFAHLNETTLFRGQWQYRRGALDAAAYERLIKEEVRPTFERLKQQVLAEGWFMPRAVYGYLPCFSEGDQLVVLDEAGRDERARFSFPRQRKPPYRCIADYFRQTPATPDLLGLFVVTIGPAASQQTAALFAAHRYRDYLHLHGLAVESAEAAAELMHRQMRQELGIAAADATTVEGLARQGYRGSRFSFGYPACPELEDQRQLFALLQPARIGVMLTDNAQMVPEQSVSAFVVHHPAAKYFST